MTSQSGFYPAAATVCTEQPVTETTEMLLCIVLFLCVEPPIETSSQP